MHSVIHGWWVLSEDAAEVLFAAVGAYLLTSPFGFPGRVLSSFRGFRSEH
jgi:hypothetical protein